MARDWILLFSFPPRSRGATINWFLSMQGILIRVAQTVLVFLTVLSTGLQYVIRHINYKRDLARIEYIVSQAKMTAWGPKMLPAGGRRKVGLLCQISECLVHQVTRSR